MLLCRPTRRQIDVVTIIPPAVFHRYEWNDLECWRHPRTAAKTWRVVGDFTNHDVLIEHKNIRQTWRGNVRIAPSSLPFFGTAAEPPSRLAGVENHCVVGIKKKKFLSISRLEAESSFINQK